MILLEFRDKSYGYRIKGNVLVYTVYCI